MTAGALATALVACGGGSSGGSSPGNNSSGGSSGGSSATAGDPTAVVTAAPDKSIAAKNAKVSITAKSAVQGQPTDISGDGGIDFAGKTTQLMLTVPGEGRTEVRQVDQVFYVKVPAQQAAEFGNKSWLKLDPAVLSGLAGSNSLGALTNNDPATYLNTLKGATNVTKVGDETIRGAHTVHYKTTVDVNKAAAAQGLTPQQKAQLQEALGGQSSAPEDVWVDDQGRVARIAADVPANAAGGGSASKSSFQLELFDYGQFSQPVTAPPADQTADFGQILGQLGSAFGSGSSGTSG